MRYLAILGCFEYCACWNRHWFLMEIVEKRVQHNSLPGCARVGTRNVRTSFLTDFSTTTGLISLDMYGTFRTDRIYATGLSWKRKGRRIERMLFSTGGEKCVIGIGEILSRLKNASLSLLLLLYHSQHRIRTHGILISSSSENHQTVYHFGEYYLPYGIFTRSPNEMDFRSMLAR